MTLRDEHKNNVSDKNHPRYFSSKHDNFFRQVDLIDHLETSLHRALRPPAANLAPPLPQI